MARKEIVQPLVEEEPSAYEKALLAQTIKEPAPRDLELDTWYEVDLGWDFKQWDWHEYTEQLHVLAGQYSDSGGTGFGMRDMQFSFSTENEAVGFVDKVRGLFEISDRQNDQNVYTRPEDADVQDIIAYVGWSESTPESREEDEEE